MTKVIVDWKTWNGDSICVDICSVEVFEMQEVDSYTDSKKSVPVKTKDCISCTACIRSCPTNAITVEN